MLSLIKRSVRAVRSLQRVKSRFAMHSVANLTTRSVPEQPKPLSTPALKAVVTTANAKPVSVCQSGYVWGSTHTENNREMFGAKVLTSAVLDWSGTVADNWVTSVSQAFVELWKESADIDITMAEARAPMGLEKSLHNAAIAAQPRVAAAWIEKYGKPIGPNDLWCMFEAFIPIQLRWLKAPGVTDLIPGAASAVKSLREKGMNIGVTTGFQRVFANELLSAAKTQGFVPDTNVAADEVARPRPFPDMMLRNIIKLKAPHVGTVLKVDDTCSGIGEGLSVGCWTCGVSHTSVYMNIDSHDHRRTLNDAEYERRGVAAREILFRAGAHFVVDDIRGVPVVADLINQLLRMESTRAFDVRAA